MPVPDSAAGLPEDPVGRRVSVRRRVGAGGSSDVVGVVVGSGADSFTVRDRAGAFTEVQVDAVLALRLVASGTGRHPRRQPTAYARPAAEVLTAAVAAWQPETVQRAGDWLLRSASGFTQRANTALAVGSPDRPVPEAVGLVTRFYRARGLRPGFQVVPAVAGALERHLGEDWVRGEQVVAMVADLPAVDAVYAGVDVAGEPDDDWWAASEYEQHSAGSGVVTRGAHAFVTARSGRDVVGVARGSVHGQWLVVTAMRVEPRVRRQGVGQELLAATAAWGRTKGARFGHLQVLVDNHAARALYARNGYAEHHRYHYRWAADA